MSSNSNSNSNNPIYNSGNIYKLPSLVSEYSNSGNQIRNLKVLAPVSNTFFCAPATCSNNTSSSISTNGNGNCRGNCHSNGHSNGQTSSSGSCRSNGGNGKSNSNNNNNSSSSSAHLITPPMTASYSSPVTFTSGGNSGNGGNSGTTTAANGNYNNQLLTPIESYNPMGTAVGTAIGTPIGNPMGMHMAQQMHFASFVPTMAGCNNEISWMCRSASDSSNNNAGGQGQVQVQNQNQGPSLSFSLGSSCASATYHDDYTTNKSFAKNSREKHHRKNSSGSSISSTSSSTNGNGNGNNNNNNNNNNEYEVNYPIQKPPLYMRESSNKSSSPITNKLFQSIPNSSQISKRKYSTSIDERNFLTVYEYQINNNYIIWDYHTGLVHLTGLWKAIGNRKADIVKLIDSSPNLINVVKRVRGGFLKIQGTWIPFNIAKQLARRFCYDIRFQLIPLFGENFVNECLRPDEKGFGLLRLNLIENNNNNNNNNNNGCTNSEIKKSTGSNNNHIFRSEYGVNNKVKKRKSNEKKDNKKKNKKHESFLSSASTSASASCFRKPPKVPSMSLSLPSPLPSTSQTSRNSNKLPSLSNLLSSPSILNENKSAKLQDENESNFNNVLKASKSLQDLNYAHHNLSTIDDNNNNRQMQTRILPSPGYTWEHAIIDDSENDQAAIDWNFRKTTRFNSVSSIPEIDNKGTHFYTLNDYKVGFYDGIDTVLKAADQLKRSEQIETKNQLDTSKPKKINSNFNSTKKEINYNENIDLSIMEAAKSLMTVSKGTGYVENNNYGLTNNRYKVGY